MSDGPGPEIGRGVPPDPDNLPIPGAPEGAKPSNQSPDDRAQPRHPLTRPETSLPEEHRVQAQSPEVTVDEEQTTEQEAAGGRAGEVREAIDEGDREEALRRALVDTDESQKNVLLEATDIIGDKQTLTPEEEESLKKKLAGMRREHVDALTELSNLTPETKERLKNGLVAMTPEEKAAEEVPEGEKEQRVAQLQELAKQTVKEAEKHGHDKYGPLAKKIHHLKEWLNPEDPAKTWALRAGKSLYVMFLVMLVAILWEMSVINKASGKR